MLIKKSASLYSDSAIHHIQLPLEEVWQLFDMFFTGFYWYWPIRTWEHFRCGDVLVKFIIQSCGNFKSLKLWTFETGCKLLQFDCPSETIKNYSETFIVGNSKACSTVKIVIKRELCSKLKYLILALWGSPWEASPERNQRILQARGSRTSRW